MIDAAAPITTQASAKQRMDRRARRLTATAGAAAIGLTGVFVGLAVGAPYRGAAASMSEPPPNADQALAKAISDFEAAAAARNASAVAPPRSQLTAAPAPARAPATARPPAVVSGGS